MEDRKLKLSRPAVLTVPEEDARALVDAGNGDAALVYLHTLLRGELNMSRAATELHRSDGDIRAAAERLRQMGILSDEAGTSPLPGEDRLPEYRAADVVRRSGEDPEFRELVQNVQGALGRTLTSADLKKLFGIYDELAMPRDVILMLVNYCRLEHTAVYGAEKPLGFAVIEKEAYIWFHREIMTFEQAEAWIAELDRRKSQTEQFVRSVGLQGRRLYPTEKKYLGEWMELGFGADALEIAADRTVTNTGKLTWKYMDSIVRSWHEKNLHTVAEIEQGDKKAEKKPAKTGSRSGFSPETKPTKADVETMKQLRQLREKMNNN